MQPPLIIGGGPAGAAAAAWLAASGRPVTLVERQAGPVDKLCGDFLSGGAVAALRRLGADALTGEAMPIRTIRLVHRDTAAEVDLPFPAFGLSRRSLDESLLCLAAQRGASVRRGVTVHGLAACPGGFVARIVTAGTPAAALPADPATTALHASAVFLATGKHDVRGLRRPRRPDGSLGLKMYYALAPTQHSELRGRIELLLLRDGYAGLQLVAPDRAVLCMLLPAARYRQAGQDWDSLLHDLCTEAPWLARRLSGATPSLPRPLAIAGTPYGHLYRPTPTAPAGLFRLGDQVCVIPSFAGDGIAIALHSGIAAAAAWLHGDSAAAYHARFAKQAGAPLRLASLLHYACRYAPAQQLLVAACRTWPVTLAAAATWTRIARHATP